MTGRTGIIHETWFFLWLLLGFSCCSVGEDYLRPSLDIPEDWSNGHGSVGETQITKLASWWSSLEDPILTELISSALEHNLDRTQAIARIKRARAETRIIMANWWPQISANGGYRRAGRGSGNNTLGVGSANETAVVRNETDSDSFTLGFDVNWELDVFGKTRRDVEAAEAGLEFALNDEKAVQSSLSAEVASHYAALRGLQHRLRVAQENLELQKQSASISERRFGAGFAGTLDLAQAKAEVANTLAAIPQLESQLKTEMHSLSLLVGAEPAHLYATLEPEKALPLAPDTLPISFPAELLDRRPDILRAEATLHRATASMGSAQADYYPQFSLSGLLSLDGNRFDSLGFWENRIWNLGASVFYPLIDGGRIRASISARSAEEEEALAAYEEAVLVALQEVENALVSIQKEKERAKFLQAAVAENRNALKAARTLYAEGLAEFLNVVSAERALYNAEDALTQSRTSELLSYIALYKSLGGGWRDDALQPRVLLRKDS